MLTMLILAYKAMPYKFKSEKEKEMQRKRVKNPSKGIIWRDKDAKKTMRE